MAPTDILGRPRALRALMALRRAEPKSMTAGDLQRAAGYTIKSAVELREDLLAWGLIIVEDKPVAGVPYMDIRLTFAGREIADLAIKAETIAKKAQRSHGG